MSKIISTFGMNGSGKSTFSSNLAYALAKRDKVVVLVGCETSFGSVQNFFGVRIPEDQGIWACLTDKTESPERLLTQAKDVNPNVYLLAVPNENYDVHVSGFEKDKLDLVFRKLTVLADYIIFDSTSDFYNGLTLYGMFKADYLYWLHKSTTADFLFTKGVQSTVKQLTEGKVYHIMGMHQMGCDPRNFERDFEVNLYGYLPDVADAPLYENSGKLLITEKGKRQNEYWKILKNWVELLIADEYSSSLDKEESHQGELKEEVDEVE